MKKFKGIEVELLTEFNVIKETLERIGIVNSESKEIYPSCYLLHKRGKYYICHFKNLYELDGKKTNYTGDDHFRQSAIVNLLVNWKMVKVTDTEGNFIVVETYPNIKVISFKNKQNYKIVHKYNIGYVKLCQK